MPVTRLWAYWILRSLWWARQCYTTARPLTPYSISGRYLCYSSKWMLYFHSWKSFKVTHLMNHMKNQISALSDPFPSLAAAAAAKSLQLCLTLCHTIDGSPLGSPVPGILQARTLEWVATSFSNAGKWKVKVKSLSHAWLVATPWTTAHQASVHGILQARVLEWGAIATLFWLLIVNFSLTVKADFTINDVSVSLVGL